MQSAHGDARWVKKGSNSVHGCRAYVAVDDTDDDVRAVHGAPANGCEMHHFAPTLAKADFTPQRVYADKNFSSQANREYLRNHHIKSAIMHRGARNRPLSERQERAKLKMSKTRRKVEQAFGAIKRIFSFTYASYFGTVKLTARVIMKSMCMNWLKAANKVRVMGQAHADVHSYHAGTNNIPKLCPSSA